MNPPFQARPATASGGFKGGRDRRGQLRHFHQPPVCKITTTSTYVKGVGEVERTTSATSGGITAVVGQLLLIEK